ncbi:MAG: DUF2254 domain-containing protein [Bosea sp. (in: a-proteobacteria)]|uniref:DUF2254 domain-containing protein n=1 Tax=Bosea sp. (in: a-proteobacteria) TaxID=1871050 RepID=UPI003F7BD671
MTRLRWVLRQLSERLWVRAALFALLGIASALASIVAAPLVPEGVSARIGADAVDKVLGILASSMLTVAIFSLSTMVSAYGAAANSATPRATYLLQADTGAQNALATFIGAFLFSLVGIIALSTGLYGSSGRLLLFIVTLLVVAVVVATFVGWIDSLSRLGRMNETIDRVAAAAADALDDYAASQTMGALPARTPPAGARAIVADRTGYVQHVDVAALAGLCEDGGEIDVARLPGAFVGIGETLAHASAFDEDGAERIRDAFIIGDRRSFSQDPRFGLIVLSEIASRALSPAVNDPGTAIDVLATLARLLTRPAPEEAPEPLANVHVPVLAPRSLIEDCIVPIARDGAGMIEVALRLQRTLATIATNPRFAEAAHELAEDGRDRALAALPHEIDRQRLLAATAGRGR